MYYKIIENMESFEIKKEIKEEPFDPDEFNSALIPKGITIKLRKC